MLACGMAQPEVPKLQLEAGSGVWGLGFRVWGLGFRV